MLSPLASLRTWSAERPGDRAVAGPGVELTAAELWDTVLRIVGWLDKRGIPRDVPIGTAVARMLEPAFQLALLARGQPAGVYPPGFPVGPGEALELLVTSRPRPDLAPRRQLVVDDQALAEWAAVDLTRVALADPGDDAVLRLLFSSGTTGTPKTIPRTARQIEASARPPRIEGLGDGRYACLLHPGAMSYQNGLLAAMLARHVHVVAETSEEAVPLLRRHGIEIVQGSPAQLDTLLAAVSRSGTTLPRLRRLISAGAPMTRAMAARLRSGLGVEVADLLGSSEVEIIGARIMDDSDRGITLAAGVVAEIVDDEDHPLPIGATGRLRVKTARQSSGYAHPVPTSPQLGFQDGWFYSGDMARLDDRGALHPIGRADDLINVGGRKLNPDLVEAAARKHPGIAEALAVPVNDAVGRRTLGLAVVGEFAADALPALIERVRRETGVAPSIVVRMAALPLSERGKPDRQAAAALLEARVQD